MKSLSLISSFLLVGFLAASAIAQDGTKEKKEKRATAKVEDGKVIIVDADGKTRTFDIGDGTAQRIVVQQETESDGTDVEVKGKAIIIGPDGEKHEIELDDLNQGIWMPEGLKGKIMLHGEEGALQALDFGADFAEGMGSFDFGGSKFMIGVNCTEVAGALKAHLDVEHGLVIDQVVDETPAAEAGLRQHDVIINVNGADVKDLQQLINAIQEAGDKSAAVQLQVIRSGDEVEVEVTPMERENPSFAFDFTEGDNEELRAKIQEMMESGDLGQSGEFRIERFGPGIIQGHRAGNDDMQEQIDELKAQIKELKDIIRQLEKDK